MKFVIELDLDNDLYRLAGGAFPAVSALLKSMMESRQFSPHVDFKDALSSRSEEKFIVLLEATGMDAAPEGNVQARVVITRDAFDRTFYTGQQAEKNGSPTEVTTSQYEMVVPSAG